MDKAQRSLFQQAENMNDSEKLIAQAQLLIRRLERMSADSIWTHRSSGYRGSLLKWLERADNNPQAIHEDDLGRLRDLLEVGFEMLENAAREYPE